MSKNKEGGSFLDYVTGVAGLVEKIVQHRQDAQLQREQEEVQNAAYEQSRSDAIRAAARQYITAHKAGIYFPENWNFFSDPVSTVMFEQALREELYIQQLPEFEDLIKKFQEESRTG